MPITFIDNILSRHEKHGTHVLNDVKGINIIDSKWAFLFSGSCTVLRGCISMVKANLLVLPL